MPLLNAPGVNCAPPSWWPRRSDHPDGQSPTSRRREHVPVGLGANRADRAPGAVAANASIQPTRAGTLPSSHHSWSETGRTTQARDPRSHGPTGAEGRRRGPRTFWGRPQNCSRGGPKAGGAGLGHFDGAIKIAAGAGRAGLMHHFLRGEGRPAPDQSPHVRTTRGTTGPTGTGARTGPIPSVMDRASQAAAAAACAAGASITISSSIAMIGNASGHSALRSQSNAKTVFWPSASIP